MLASHDATLCNLVLPPQMHLEQPSMTFPPKYWTVTVSMGLLCSDGLLRAHIRSHDSLERLGKCETFLHRLTVNSRDKRLPQSRVILCVAAEQLMNRRQFVVLVVILHGNGASSRAVAHAHALGLVTSSECNSFVVKGVVQEGVTKDVMSSSRTGPSTMTWPTLLA